jgi:hypothetical protein
MSNAGVSYHASLFPNTKQEEKQDGLILDLSGFQKNTSDS